MKADQAFQQITDSIITALEQGQADPDGWRAPWSKIATFPLNANSKRHYRSTNALYLTLVAAEKGYTSPYWATYGRENKDGTLTGWRKLGGQVRKGEKATQVLLWKPLTKPDPDDAAKTIKFFYAKPYNVFNADQVDGWTPPTVEQRDPIERDAAADKFFAATGLDIHHGGNKAYYEPFTDYVNVPPVAQFDHAEGYYSTLGHEATHATAAQSRCDRDLTGRFGDEAYAAEELVAELGSAFLGAHLGIETVPRADHGHYIANWLQVLRGDPKAVVTAASKAQQAVDWLTTAAGDATVNHEGVAVSV